jgi:uncharacterized small protein (DUF1192 family)
MLSTILSIVAGLLEAVGKIASIFQAWQQKQVGVDEVDARNAKAEAEAARKEAEIATQGQTNDQTQADLDRGDF